MRAICCAILSLVCAYSAVNTNKDYVVLGSMMVLAHWLLLIVAIVLMILGM